MSPADQTEPGDSATHRAQWRRQASSFGAVADLYDRIRPSYPPAALAWALAPLGTGRWTVADIGAGTGKMTRLIAAAGHHAVAIEPDAQMRTRLVEATPGVTASDGRAERLPLPAGGIDAAIAAQAYHWFDHDRAHAELARVIRPGGVFAAVWNDRVDEAGWVAEYTRIIEGDRGRDGSARGLGPLSFGDGFGPVDLAQFHHSTSHTPQTLVLLLRSRSYFLTASPERQAVLEATVQELAADHPDLAGRAEFELPYVTHVYRAARLPG